MKTPHTSLFADSFVLNRLTYTTHNGCQTTCQKKKKKATPGAFHSTRKLCRLCLASMAVIFSSVMTVQQSDVTTGKSNCFCIEVHFHLISFSFPKSNIMGVFAVAWLRVKIVLLDFSVLLKKEVNKHKSTQISQWPQVTCPHMVLFLHWLYWRCTAPFPSSLKQIQTWICAADQKVKISIPLSTTASYCP